MENKENVTKEKQDLPYIVLKRLDCLEQQTKEGAVYYMFNGLIRQNDRTLVATFFTKDKSLYGDILSIPQNKEFKLYYELHLDFNNNWKIKPVACGL